MTMEAGRSATALLLRLVRRVAPPRVFLPEVHCAHVVKALRRLHIPLVFVPLVFGRWTWDVSRVRWARGLALQTHLFGQVADPPPRVAGLVVVEDCAHSVRAHGATSDFQLYSTGREKPLDLGGGGYLASQDDTADWTTLRHRHYAWAAQAERSAVVAYYAEQLPVHRTEHLLVLPVSDKRRAQQRLWDHGFLTFQGISGFAPGGRGALRSVVILPLCSEWTVRQHKYRRGELTQCL